LRSCPSTPVRDTHGRGKQPYACPVTIRSVALGVLVVIRWWFGLTYLLTGAGLIIAGIVLIIMGQDVGNGIYAILSGPIIGVLGWLVHPWGLQRTMR
jgi:hypothetical protein